ncbi:NfeD family protein [Roseateles saccharophilus]|uniref:Membrane protein implicated in regulation of membrane protease activity n=1 Tax=Roseateles saccharophilus TaxID=304 RepID=A0A4R3VIJ0_ROSSA|nr:NfeD family protein [Roseateles saccharophilus]MDG0832482.1 NfeD family protein [Roseateles saccharophilus]TCV03943.1 membrane protein implicated in regulation of membrane protease activity [Roseateles saccharophilus]
MDWSTATVWWISAGLMVAAELASGTFYLLMLAVGACAGALAAHLGLGVTAQVVAAALVGGAAVIVLNRRRSRGPKAAPASSNADMNLDIGQSVQVDAWSSDGLTQVQYRGAAWQARFIGAPPARSGRHVIRAVEGSCLLLDR